MDKKFLSLTGFIEKAGNRVFSFERVSADRSREHVTVSTDLALSRQYGIRLQELPLLCIALLEQASADSGVLEFALSEDVMRAHAGENSARQAALKARKYQPRPANVPPVAASAIPRFSM
jgi:hypothetical protein